MQKHRSGRTAINTLPPYMHNAPKGAGLDEARVRPPLPFCLIKPTKINLSLFGRSDGINRDKPFSHLPKKHVNGMAMRV